MRIQMYGESYPYPFHRETTEDTRRYCMRQSVGQYSDGPACIGVKSEQNYALSLFLQDYLLLDVTIPSDSDILTERHRWFVIIDRLTASPEGS